MKILKINSTVCVLVLVLSLLASSFNVCFAADAAATTVVAAPTYEATVLKELGVIKDTNALTFSREKFLDAAMKLRGYKPEADAKYDVPFVDVIPGSDCEGAIVYAVNAGIIEVGDGYIEPDLAVTTDFALEVLANAMGYSDIAKLTGGYYSLPITNTLLSGIDTSKEELTVNEVYQMLYNAMNENIAQQITFGNHSEYDYDTEISMLNKYLNIYKASGIVTAVPKAAIKGSPNLAKNEIIISDVTYETSNVDNFKLLGHKVKYYYHYDKDSEDNTKEIMSIVADDKDYLKISADDIVTKTNLGTYRYSDENGKATNVDYKRTSSIIYNGKILTGNQYQLDLLFPKSGYVELIDPDGSGFSVLNIVSTFNTFVLNASNSGNVYAFTDKYKSGSVNTNLSFDTNDTNLFVTVHFNGEKVGLDTIAQNDVLTVAKSIDGTVYDVIITRSSKDIIVNTLDGDKVKAEDIEYQISPQYMDYINEGNPLTPGGRLTVYFDAYGYIGAIDLLADTVLTAYLVGIEANTTFDNYIIMRVYDENQQFQILYARTRINLDGTTYKQGQFQNVVNKFFKDGLLVPQLIRITVSGDTVKKIDSAEKTVNESDNSLVQLHKLSSTTQESKESETTLKYAPSTKYFGDGIYLTNDAKVFAIPIGDYASDDDYAVTTQSIFNSQTYIAKVYKTDDSEYEGSLVLYQYYPKFNLVSGKATETPFASIHYADTCVVTGISKDIIDGDEKTRLHYVNMKDGKETVKEVAWPDEVNNLSYGDVVRCYTGIKGNLAFIGKVFDYSDRGFVAPLSLGNLWGENKDHYIFTSVNARDKSWDDDTNSPKPAGKWRVSYFDVMSCKDGYIKCITQDLSDPTAAIDPANINIFKKGSFYRVFKYNSKTKTLMKVDNNSIIGYDTDSENYTKMVVYSENYSTINMAIIMD